LFEGGGKAENKPFTPVSEIKGIWGGGIRREKSTALYGEIDG
jgi:hypothetical protein